jgi:hypothetical protein
LSNLIKEYNLPNYNNYIIFFNYYQEENENLKKSCKILQKNEIRHFDENGVAPCWRKALRLFYASKSSY